MTNKLVQVFDMYILLFLLDYLYISSIYFFVLRAVHPFCISQYIAVTLGVILNSEFITFVTIYHINFE